jgi:hypothetical protein
VLGIVILWTVLGIVILWTVLGVVILWTVLGVVILWNGGIDCLSTVNSARLLCVGWASVYLRDS